MAGVHRNNHHTAATSPPLPKGLPARGPYGALHEHNAANVRTFLLEGRKEDIVAFLSKPGKWARARYVYSTPQHLCCIATSLREYIDAVPGLRGRMARLQLDYHALLSASTLAKTRATSRATGAPTSQATQPCTRNIKLGRPKPDCGWINADKLDRFLLRAKDKDVQSFMKTPGDWAFAHFAHCSDRGHKHEHGSLEQYLRARPELRTRLRQLEVQHPALQAINMPKRALRTASAGTGTVHTTGAGIRPAPAPTATPIASSSTGAGQEVRLRKENKKQVHIPPGGIPATSQVSKNSGPHSSHGHSRLQANTSTQDIASTLDSRHIGQLIELFDATTAAPRLASNDIGAKLHSAPAGQACTFFLKLVSTDEIYACQIARKPPKQSPTRPMRLFGSRSEKPPLPSYEMTVLGTAHRNTNRGTQETTRDVLVRKLQAALSHTDYAKVEINVRSLALLPATSLPEAGTVRRPSRTSSPAAHQGITQFLTGKVLRRDSEHSDSSALEASSNSQESPSPSPRDLSLSDNQSSGPPPNSVDSHIGQSNAQKPNDIALKAAEDNEMEYFAPDFREWHMEATLAFTVLPGEPADSSRILFANAEGNTLDQWARLDSRPHTFFLHMRDHWLAGLVRRQDNSHEIAMFSSIAPTDGEFVPENFTALMRPAFAEFLQRVMAMKAASTNSAVSDLGNVELTLCARALQNTPTLSEACGYFAMHMAHEVHRILQRESQPGASLAAYFEDACAAWEQHTDKEKSDILNDLKKRMKPSSDNSPAASTISGQ